MTPTYPIWCYGCGTKIDNEKEVRNHWKVCKSKHWDQSCLSKRSDQDCTRVAADENTAPVKLERTTPLPDLSANHAAENVLFDFASPLIKKDWFLEGVRDFKKGEYRLPSDITFFSLKNVDDKMYFLGYTYAESRFNMLWYGAPVAPPNANA